jgi:hypothetical protein
VLLADSESASTDFAYTKDFGCSVVDYEEVACR